MHPTKGQRQVSHCLVDNLGYTLNSEIMQLSVPARRSFAVKHAAPTLLASSAKDKRWVSAELLCSFVGSA